MNYVLDLPIVSDIQYDGSIESKVEIENLLNAISVIIESSKGKCYFYNATKFEGYIYANRRFYF